VGRKYGISLRDSTIGTTSQLRWDVVKKEELRKFTAA
jgi:hypothetical protein